MCVFSRVFDFAGLTCDWRAPSSLLVSQKGLCCCAAGMQPRTNRMELPLIMLELAARNWFNLATSSFARECSATLLSGGRLSALVTSGELFKGTRLGSVKGDFLQACRLPSAVGNLLACQNNNNNHELKREHEHNNAPPPRRLQKRSRYCNFDQPHNIQSQTRRESGPRTRFRRS